MSKATLSKADLISILGVSDMVYMRTAPSSPITSRQQKVSFATGGANVPFGPSSKCTIDLQYGTDWMSTQDSYLVFDLTVSGAAAGAYMLGGGAMNLIRDTQVATRSGKEIDRITNANLLMKHEIQAENPSFVRTNLNSLFFAQPGDVANVDASTAAGRGLDSMSRSLLADGVTERVMIPLRYLAGVFGVKKLIPGAMARGLRLQLTLASAAEALTVHTAGQVATFTITNVHVNADTFRLDDSVNEFLSQNFLSKSSGLVLEYQTWNTTLSPLADVTAANLEVRQTVSLGTQVMAVFRSSASIENIEKDSFASIPVEEKQSSQYRLGSHYYPNQRTEGKVEHYQQSLYARNLQKYSIENGYDLTKFIGSAADRGFGAGNISMVLARSNVIELSGLSISNSRTLGLDVQSLAAGAKNAYVFLKHLRRAVLFLESVTLEV